MIKRILVAIDGSDSANAALSIAGSIAGIIGAQLVGLFVEDSRRFAGSNDSEVEKTIEAESVRLYQAFNDRCANAKVDGRFLSLRGTPHEVIAERAKTVDFVVMGSQGEHKDVQGKYPGQTFEALIAALSRPALIVPADVAGEPKIVVGYDGTLPSDRALRAAAEFAEISEMNELHLLTATATPDKCRTIQAPALEYLSAYDLQVTPVCVTGEPEAAILSYVDQIDASVVVLAAFGPNRVKQSVFGTTTQAVIKSAQAAVLLVG